MPTPLSSRCASPLSKVIEKTTEETFPSPAVPISPILSFGSFGGIQRSRSPSILDVGQTVMFTSGRMAIAAAVKHMGLGQGDKVLVPAYHCTSMVDPFLWASVEPVFYRINEDLSVDLDDIRRKCDDRTRCLLVAHYFGFYQDIERIRAFCDQQELLLLEDCAHAFFGENAGRPVGSFGDYAIASPMKFFPIYDGGCLVSSTRDLSAIKQVPAGMGFQIKAVFNPMEKAVNWGRLQPFSFLLRFGFNAASTAWKAIKHLTSHDLINAAPDALNGGYEFDPGWLDVSMSWPSQILMNRISTERVANRRRQNFTRIAEALRGEPGCKVLFQTVEQSVIPYVMPLVVEDHQRVFHDLKMQQVPIYRWENLGKSECAVSRRYSQQLLQIPCHQGLTMSEVDWIIQRLLHVLSKAKIKTGY